MSSAMLSQPLQQHHHFFVVVYAFEIIAAAAALLSAKPNLENTTIYKGPDLEQSYKTYNSVLETTKCCR